MYLQTNLTQETCLELVCKAQLPWSMTVVYDPATVAEAPHAAEHFHQVDLQPA